MASFAHLFHVRPWETGRLSLGQFDLLAAAVDDMQRGSR
jgi:hypothetical protein